MSTAAAAPGPAGPAQPPPPPQPSLSAAEVRELCAKAFASASVICVLRKVAIDLLHSVQNGPCGPGSMLASDFRMKLSNAAGPQAWSLCPSFEGSKVKSVLVGAEAVFKAKYVPGETSKAVVLDLEGLQEVAADPSKCTEWTPSPAANAPPPAPGPQASLPPSMGGMGPGPAPPLGPAKGGKAQASMQAHALPPHPGDAPGDRELGLVMMAMALYRPGTPAAPSEHLATLRCKLACLLARAADSPLGPHTALGTHLGDALGKYAPEAWQALPSAGSRLQRLADSCLLVEQGGGALAMRLDVQELERQATQAALQEWRSLGPLPGSNKKQQAAAAMPDGGAAPMGAPGGAPRLPPTLGLDPTGHVPPAKDDEFGLAIAAATIAVWCPQKWHLAAAVLAMLGQPGHVAVRNGGRTCSQTGFFLKEVERIAPLCRVPSSELKPKFLAASEPLLSFQGGSAPSGVSIVALQVPSMAHAVLAAAATAAAGGDVAAAGRLQPCWPPNVQDFPVGQLHQQAQPLARHLVHVLSGGDGPEARNQLLARCLRQLEMLASMHPAPTAQPQPPMPPQLPQPPTPSAAQQAALQQQAAAMQQQAAMQQAVASLALRGVGVQQAAGMQQRPSIGAPGTPMQQQQQQQAAALVPRPGGPMVALGPGPAGAAMQHAGLLAAAGKQAVPGALMPHASMLQQLSMQQAAQQGLNHTQMLMAAQAMGSAGGMPAMPQPDMQALLQRLTQLLTAAYPQASYDAVALLRKTAAVHLALAMQGPAGPHSMALADLCRILRTEDTAVWQAVFGNQPDSQMLRDTITLLNGAPGFAFRPGVAFDVAVQLDIGSLERAALSAPPMPMPQSLGTGMLMGPGGAPAPGLQLTGAAAAAAAAAAGSQAIQAAMQAQQQQQALMLSSSPPQPMQQLSTSVGSAGNAPGSQGGGMPGMPMRGLAMGGMMGGPGGLAPGMPGAGGGGMQLNSGAPAFVPGGTPTEAQAAALRAAHMQQQQVSMQPAGSGALPSGQGAPSVSSTTSSLAGGPIGGGGGGGGGRAGATGSGPGNGKGGALPASLSRVDGGVSLTDALAHPLTNQISDALAHPLTTLPMTHAADAHSQPAGCPARLTGGVLPSLQAAIQQVGVDLASLPAPPSATGRAAKKPPSSVASTPPLPDVSPAQLCEWAAAAFAGPDPVSVVRRAAVELLAEVGRNGPARAPYTMEGPALGLALAKKQPDAYRALPCSAQGKLRLKAVCDGCAVFERSHTHQTQVCVRLNVTALEAAAAGGGGVGGVAAKGQPSSKAAAKAGHGKKGSAEGRQVSANAPQGMSAFVEEVLQAAEHAYPSWEPLRDLKLAAVKLLASIGPEHPSGPRVRPLGNHSMMGPEFGNAMSRAAPGAWSSLAGSNKLFKLCNGDRFLQVLVAPSGDNRAIRLDIDALLAAAGSSSGSEGGSTNGAAASGSSNGVAAGSSRCSTPSIAANGAPAGAGPADKAALQVGTLQQLAAVGSKLRYAAAQSDGAVLASVAPCRTAPHSTLSAGGMAPVPATTAHSTPRKTAGALPLGSTMIGLNPDACQYWPSSPIQVPASGPAGPPAPPSVASSNSSTSVKLSVPIPEAVKSPLRVACSSPFHAAVVADGLEFARATVTAVGPALEHVKGAPGGLHVTAVGACRASSGVGDEALEGALKHQETALLHLIAE